MLPSFSLLSPETQSSQYLHSWLPLFLLSCSSNLSLTSLSLLTSHSPHLSPLPLSVFLSSLSSLRSASLSHTEASCLRNLLVFLPRPLSLAKLEAPREREVEILGLQALSLAQAVLGPSRFREIMAVINNFSNYITSDFIHKLFFKDVIELNDELSMDVIVIDLLKSL